MALKALVVCAVFAALAVGLAGCRQPEERKPPAPPPARMPPIEDKAIYRKEGFYTAFPGLFKSPDDTAYVWATARFRRSHHDGRGERHSFKSTDGGRTWVDGEKPSDLGRFVTRQGTLLHVHSTGWRRFPKEKADELRKQGWTVHEEPDCVTALTGIVNVKRSTDDGKTWQKVPNDIRTPSLMTFGSPVCMPDNAVLFPIYGKSREGRKNSSSMVLRSTDDGLTWNLLTIAEDAKDEMAFNETDLLALPDGRVIALIRIAGAEQFLYQSESSDGGATWAAPVRTPMWGYPCDLLLLDSGEVLCAYGYRRNPMGVRACLSCDGGRTWDIEHELVLRGDGFGGSDLGYPKVVQFSDGNILIVYYFTRCDGITHIRCARLRREHFGMRTQLAPDLVSDIALGTASSAHDPGGQALPSPDAVTDGRLDEASVWEWSGPEATIEFRFPWEQTIDTAELHAGRPGCGLHGWPQAVTWEGEGENGWQVLAEMAITGSDSVGPNGAVSCRFEAAVVKAVRLKLTARPASEGAEANIVREVVFRHTKAQEWVDQEHETGDSGWASLYGTAPRIQRFVPQKRTITAVGIRICHASRFYEPHECGVTVSVRNDPEGGQALATSSLDKDSIRAGWNIFKLDSPLEVEPGKPYWIEVKCTKPVAATARWVLTTGTDYKDGCLEGTEPEKSISIGFRTYYK